MPQGEVGFLLSVFFLRSVENTEAERTVVTSALSALNKEHPDTIRKYFLGMVVGFGVHFYS